MKLFQKVQFGELNELNAEVIWRGTADFPSETEVAQLCLGLPIAKASLTPKGSSITGRELSYAVGWISAYVKTTIKILSDDFVSDKKSFEMLLLRSKELSEMDLIVRLITVGVSGATQYRIAWRRVEAEGGDLFFCIE